MTPHAALVFAIGVTALCAICAACFLLWLLWSLAWDIYDGIRARHLRIKDRELNHFSTGAFKGIRDWKYL